MQQGSVRCGVASADLSPEVVQGRDFSVNDVHVIGPVDYVWTTLGTELKPVFC
jgi:hypothetical protein